MRPRTSRRISPALSSALMCFEAAVERDREGFRQLADRPLAPGKLAQHTPACGVAEGVEDGVQPGGF